MWPQRIAASCPCCGQVELAVKDVQLLVCVARPELSEYSFRCPACRILVTKLASGEVISKLLSVNVAAEALHIPAEALELHDGPPITADDVLDLHEALAAGDVWAELAP